MSKADSVVLRLRGEFCSEWRKHYVTLGENCRAGVQTQTRTHLHTHIYALSHPVSDSYPADWDAGVETVHHIAATTVTTLFCPASISVTSRIMESEKLFQQQVLPRESKGGGQRPVDNLWLVCCLAMMDVNLQVFWINLFDWISVLRDAKRGWELSWIPLKCFVWHFVYYRGCHRWLFDTQTTTFGLMFVFWDAGYGYSFQLITIISQLLLASL